MLRFSWDERKAARNLRDHGVSFPEAATAFGDPLSLTVPDPDHSESEERFLLLGHRSRIVSSSSSMLSARQTRFGSSALASPPATSGVNMKKAAKKSSGKTRKAGAKRPATRTRREPSMRAEYDFSGAVRGKYAKRFADGSNVVVLEPDVAEAFPTSKAVNAALRAKLEAPKRGAASKRRTA